MTGLRCFYNRYSGVIKIKFPTIEKCINTSTYYSLQINLALPGFSIRNFKVKIKIIVMMMAAVCSFSSMAETVAQGEEAVSHAGRMMDAANARVDAAASSYGTGTPDSWANASDSAAREQANAHAQMNGAISTLASSVAIQAGPMATPQKTPQATPTINTPQAVPTLQRTPSYSVPTPTAQLTPQIAPTKQLTPSYSVPTVKQQLTPQDLPTKQPQITGASYRAYINQLEQAQTINVAVSSLKPSTLVNVTVNGITKTTTAGVIAAVNPSVQVAVPHVPAFQVNTGKGSKNDKASSHSIGGSGNGANNAANTNSAHGLGGGPHIGGGSAMGGGFHGSW